jgi:hypothetical protein
MTVDPPDVNPIVSPYRDREETTLAKFRPGEARALCLTPQRRATKDGRDARIQTAAPIGLAAILATLRVATSSFFQFSIDGSGSQQNKSRGFRAESKH